MNKVNKLQAGLIELRFYVQLNTKMGHFGDVPKPVSSLGMEKQNLTQQKHTFTNQKKCTTTQNKHKKLQPDLVASYDIPPGNEVGLFWFQRFINLSPIYLLRHLPTYLKPRTHTGLVLEWNVSLCILYTEHLFHLWGWEWPRQPLWLCPCLTHTVSNSVMFCSVLLCVPGSAVAGFCSETSPLLSASSSSARSPDSTVSKTW